MTDVRCAHGLITAKLTGRPDYEELVRIYSERLRQTDKGFYLPKLQALIADLAALSA